MFKGSVASQDLGEVVRALKSAAEPTRLRLLVLLSHGELTVGELCCVLGQSQPRISRHLRVLTEAGFLDHFREQQCVYYRAPVGGRSLEWSRQLLSMVDPDARLLKHDRENAASVVMQRADVATRQLSGSQPGSSETGSREDLTSVLLEELGPSSIGELLDIGTGAGLMLEILGPRAEHAVGIDISAPALRLARTRVHGAGPEHCEFRRGDMYALAVRGRSFDTVTIDRVLTLAERPAGGSSRGRTRPRPGGRLVVIEDFEQLAARADDNPFAQLRRWLAGGGLVAGRLRPCDLAERHYLVALARHASQNAGAVPASLHRNMVSA